MIEFLKQPWPWYFSGVIIGLMVPALLVMGNKSFGISANFRHICAACFPGNVRFFKYNWKKEIWNLFFVAGIMIGGFIAARFFADANAIQVDPDLLSALKSYNVTDTSKLLPSELFSWPALLSLRGFILLVIGGFLVGFGTRYAGGCTSGHAIMGLSNLQWPSLVATISFMIGGFIMANLILPYILSL
ncbi:MAG TPA: YeeE/YedE thiosulfate transporter family protein [Parafilimonas sp.]|nr:YeeE/YedE thiosulfate transporter family protein [Parafilimonas sp.]